MDATITEIYSELQTQTGLLESTLSRLDTIIDIMSAVGAVGIVTAFIIILLKWRYK